MKARVGGDDGLAPARLVTTPLEEFCGGLQTRVDRIDRGRLLQAAAPGGSEKAALAFTDRDVRVSVVRLPPTVHGEDHGFVPRLIGIARQRGVSAYPGDGSNRWPAVHRLDAASLFRLALKDASARTRLHAVGDEGVPVRDIAEVIGRHLELPVTPISIDDAGNHFGWIGAFFALHVPASSTLTQKQFDWRPTQPGLLADLSAGHYFSS